MDPKTKEFVPVPNDMPASDPRASWARFTVGEPVEINGVEFRIRKITNKDVVLRPAK